MSDIEPLIQRCQAGELAAFSELFRLYETDAYRLALTILHNEQDAEDAVQDVFLRLFERINKYKGQSAFKTWFTSIVVNTCRDKLRRRKVRYAISLDWIRNRAGGDNVSEEVSERQERQKLMKMVNQLEEKYRLPIILHYLERYSCDEVAQILELRTSLVYSRLNTARNKLRAMAKLESDKLPLVASDSS